MNEISTQLLAVSQKSTFHPAIDVIASKWHGAVEAPPVSSGALGRGLGLQWGQPPLHGRGRITLGLTWDVVILEVSMDESLQPAATSAQSGSKWSIDLLNHTRT